MLDKDKLVQDMWMQRLIADGLSPEEAERQYAEMQPLAALGQDMLIAAAEIDRRWAEVVEQELGVRLSCTEPTKPAGADDDLNPQSPLAEEKKP